MCCSYYVNKTNNDLFAYETGSHGAFNEQANLSGFKNKKEIKN